MKSPEVLFAAATGFRPTALPPQAVSDMPEATRLRPVRSAADPKSRGAYYVSSPEVHENPNLVTGFTAQGFEEVRTLLENSIKIGDDIGAGVAAYGMRGEWAGGEKVVPKREEDGVRPTGSHRQSGVLILANRLRPYDEKSLTRPSLQTHIVIAMFVDKKLLSWDDRVAKYWPEFGVGNKEDVTIGDIVRHKGGVGWFDWDISLDDTEDLDRLAVKLANQEHNWGGKRLQSYSGMTGGYYLNEILRRVDPKHRTVGKILMEDIMPRLGENGWTPEFYYMLSEELEPRMAPFVGYPKMALLFRLFMPKWLWTPSDGFGIFGKKSASRASVNRAGKEGNASTDTIGASSQELTESTFVVKKAKSRSKLFKTAPKGDGAGEEDPRPKEAKSTAEAHGDAAESPEDGEVISPVFRQMLNKSSVAGKSLNHSTPLATVAALMAQGGTLYGQTIISEETTRKANEVLSTEYDQW
ncbi:MAG: beta-lactamase/transpeptidase-like protein [Olpidium bornovanus]|uniref:Beta-lactamase/transpeptidase-like protein n=1 Tax=Olpidium bornovanus TaxID=278681 RepID=A0A8H7ZTC5_9FUNG|nr:MAG: beta-lactamase/transpeptidase-like protein [Olpidium bornovanus]